MSQRTSLYGKCTDYSGARSGCRHGCLYDFDVDGFALKANHKRWLSEKVVPLLKGNAREYTVHIVGATSRSGSEAHNVGLGIQRAMAVVQHLRSAVPGALLFPYSRGESLADQKNPESAADRAVVVTVKRNQVSEKSPNRRDHDPVLKSMPRQVKPAPPNPLIDPPGPSKTEEFGKGKKPFRIKLKSGTIHDAGLGVVPFAGVGTAELLFTIQDLGDKYERDYSFSGMGRSLSITAPMVPKGFRDVMGPRDSTTTFSDEDVWNDFQGDWSKAITDFNGMAEWSLNLNQSTWDLQITLFDPVITIIGERIRIPNFRTGKSQSNGLPGVAKCWFTGEFKGHGRDRMLRG
jgi:hypothetical protein